MICPFRVHSSFFLSFFLSFLSFFFILLFSHSLSLYPSLFVSFIFPLFLLLFFGLVCFFFCTLLLFLMSSLVVNFLFCSWNLLVLDYVSITVSSTPKRYIEGQKNLAQNVRESFCWKQKPILKGFHECNSLTFESQIGGSVT
jgi:hypothetical protein